MFSFSHLLIHLVKPISLGFYKGFSYTKAKTLNFLFISGMMVLIFSCSENINNEMESVQSSQVAYAYPIDNIVLDGDISDWPEKTMEYAIEHSHGDKPRDEKDFTPSFKVGYNKQQHSLYFAVMVADESHIINDKWPSPLTEQDGHQLLLDENHAENGSGAIIYQIAEQGINPIISLGSWDPNLDKVDPAKLKMAMKRYDSETVYEYQIKLDEETKNQKSFGLDYLIFDQDGDGHKNFSLKMWGETMWKQRTAGRLGTLVLADKALGTLQGQLEWQDSTISHFPEKVRITSLLETSLWMDVPVDSLGMYSVKLPADRYKVSLTNSLFREGESVYMLNREKSGITCKVKENRVTQSQPLQLSKAPPPMSFPEKGLLYNFDSDKKAQVDQFIEDYRHYYKIPGVSLALIKKGKVVYHNTYGQMNSYTNEAVSKNTLFEAASLTKPVFGFTVCRLAEKGIIDLDKPLYQYLRFPDIEHDERHKLITARYVLSHQTGFPNWPTRQKDGTFDLKFTPGTSYGYSGEGFEYLKRVVVHITGKKIHEILKEEVLIPLKMDNTHFEKSKHLLESVSHGHLDGLPKKVEVSEEPSMAGGMYTEALDFTNFILALSKRKGLQPKTYSDFFKIQTVISDDENDLKEYFGLGIYHELSSNGRAFGHDGNNGDFQCQFMMYEDLEMGYVIFTNSNTGGNLAYEALGKFLILGEY
ncbi:serine hydrolase [Flagellimonas sp. CMM7]|uniref:serine hydrolase n=1 Tax=Flagellimonas sp. CMM7 TaxID=2654676 RepID=UPI0013D646EC|nr:serine hydrolase [Flagellimonas sp. CMM7]UII80080.1 serine hydrolase [Flagellimonas sp. CMM7]